MKLNLPNNSQLYHSAEEAHYLTQPKCKKYETRNYFELVNQPYNYQGCTLMNNLSSPVQKT